MKQFWIFDFGFSICGPQKKKSFAFASVALLFALRAPVEAQQGKKMPMIGYLTLSAGSSERDEVFRQELRDLGWRDGENVRIEYQWLAGKTDRLAPAIEELTRKKVDVIFSTSAPITEALKKAQTTIPIVMPALPSRWKQASLRVLPGRAGT